MEGESMGAVENRVAVVTGAAQGIGEVYAKALASEGAEVVVADIKEAEAESVAQDIRAGGGEASSIRVDVSDKADTLELAAEVRRRYGGAHILVNNAAI